MAATSWKYKLGKIPFLFTLFFICFICYNFTLGYLIPLFRNSPFSAVLLSASHWFSVVLIAWSVIRCSFTDPGFVKNFIYSEKVSQNDQEAQYQVTQVEEVPSSASLDELMVYAKEPLLNKYTRDSPITTVKVTTQIKDKKDMASRGLFSPEELMHYKYCSKCQEVKPPRAHHCSICGLCIMRMDHHCPWVGTCVGLRNHKYFILFLMYTMLGCLQVFLCLITNRDEGESLAQMLVRYKQLGEGLSLTFMFSIVFAIATAVLFGVHVYLILTNKSTLENDALNFENPFNMGKEANWKQIFGEDKKTWWLPVDPRQPINGLDYPANRSPLISHQ